MVYEFFDGPLSPIVSALSWSIVIWLVTYSIVFKTKIFNYLISNPLSPPFLALPALMFAFLMGFMASESWQNYSQAKTSIINETAAIERILNIPLKPEVFQVKSNDYVKSYLQSVLDDEWGAKHNQSSSVEAHESLNLLELNLWQASDACSDGLLPKASCTSSVSAAAYIKAIDDLRLAREQRLSLGYQSSRTFRWFLGIILGLISAISVAAVHKHNQRTGTIALTLYCLSMWMAFSMVTLNIHPYKWSEVIKPTPLISILEKIKR
jgi:ABC-type multidrug transport system fused ATPase/permease subunit